MTQIEIPIEMQEPWAIGSFYMEMAHTNIYT